MKLYTEEELLKAMSYSRSYDANWVMTENEILKLITPIELPSDDDIKDKSFNKFTQSNARTCFEEGAKWMKEQILKNNK
jgi:hypothetical protein